MRVLLAGTHSGLVGGTETYQRDVAAALLGAGDYIAVLAEHPVPVGRQVIAPRGDVPEWITHDIGVESALARITAWQPDVVYAHGLASPELECALLDRWPGVLFAHSYYGTCATGTKRHAFPTVVACERRLGVGCLLLHYPRRCGGLDPAVMWDSYRRQLRRLALIPRYHGVCVASRHMGREYRRHGLAANRIHVTPLPPTGARPERVFPAPRRTGLIVFIGRLTDLKGGAFVLRALPDAAAQLGRPLRLQVLGDGPDAPHLKSLAARLGVDARFTAWLPAEERNRLLREETELLAVPSVWPEPWGLVGLEAACFGVPAVAFASGGIPEWLEAGVSGELAPASPPRVAGFTAAIVRALADPSHHAALCRGAWERAREFTMERHLAALRQVLHQAVTGA